MEAIAMTSPRATSTLASPFLALLGDRGAPLADAPDLEAVLGRALEGARAAWPTLDLAPESFLAFVARHFPTLEGDPIRALEAMHADDMYLVAACLAGDPHAIAVFETEFLVAHSPTLVRLQLAPDLLEETRQVLRHRFFVGGPSSPPKLGEYSGAGTLRGWVRVATVRTAFTLRRTPSALVHADVETLARIASPEGNLELDYLKRQYGAAAKEALHAALAALKVRERNLLRQSFALEMSIDELALVYAVHRSTVARWVTAARAALVAATREEIKRRHHLAEEDVSSILALIQSQLGDAIGEVLGVGEAPPTA